ncbi:MAG TPA: hypothetical protein DDZ66_12735 [Firmicutes bacterium]|jgi:sugar phosphate isomerase/epimerase|nr:hypothetical protein [Bacillota bacterium]
MKPKIMFSSRVFGNDVQVILDYAVTEGYDGVEWYLNSFRLRTSKKHREQFFEKLDQYPGLYYTFHLPTVDVELAHREPIISGASLGYLQLYIEYLAPWFLKQDVPPVLTLHVGSNSISVEELDWEVALTNLKQLGDFAAQRNGVVLLENLKVGWTTDPKTHLQMADHAGLGITFDTGHAASNPLVRSGELHLVDYADALSQKIRHVHFYAYESLDQGRHMPPETWMDVAEIWSKVVALPDAQSVVLELSTEEELAKTFDLLMDNKDKWQGR